MPSLNNSNYEINGHDIFVIRILFLITQYRYLVLISEFFFEDLLLFQIHVRNKLNSSLSDQRGDDNPLGAV